MRIGFTNNFIRIIFFVMEIYVSIDGVLRNFIQKFNYHYNDAFLNSEFENENEFEYNINYPIQNDNLLNSYKFQSIEEFEFFTYIEYPIEIFGHAGLSYSTSISDLNKIIFDNPQHNITVIGMDEIGKSKPATLFFLSKNGFLGNNIRFVKSVDIKKDWEKCDLWITDNLKIIELKPEEKNVIKFKTQYNEFFTTTKEISKLTEIQQLWSNSLEKTTTLTLTESPKNVEPNPQ
jgi:hypothetical protein